MAAFNTNDRMTAFSVHGRSSRPLKRISSRQNLFSFQRTTSNRRSYPTFATCRSLHTSTRQTHQTCGLESRFGLSGDGHLLHPFGLPSRCRTTAIRFQRTFASTHILQKPVENPKLSSLKAKTLGAFRLFQGFQPFSFKSLYGTRTQSGWNPLAAGRSSICPAGLGSAVFVISCHIKLITLFPSAEEYTPATLNAARKILLFFLTDFSCPRQPKKVSTFYVYDPCDIREIRTSMNHIVPSWLNGAPN